ncbi:MAG TPA: sugar ABC transporter ATP-binding protein [Limnochordia bacterium]|nr:sugar ABC transporter ATP-binding protein [Limnochordia bacterium]
MKLEARNIFKSFGAIKAVQNVSITFEGGKVRALVGENGAGKSTLLKVLAGVHAPDSGEVFLDGAAFKPTSLTDAAKHGVALVMQETNINPCLSIAENIFIDRLREFRRKSGLIDRRRMQKAAQGWLDSIGADIDAREELRKLNVGQWKMIELARAMSTEPKVLLLDEVTAFLNRDEMESFYALIETLKGRGIAIGFISHHLNEVFSLADNVTVLKDGCSVADVEPQNVTQRELERLMVGRDIGESMYPPRQPRQRTEKALSVQELHVPGRVEGVSFDLYSGEVLGIGGLKGSGGESILKALYGDMPFRTGTVLLHGAQYHPRAPFEAIERGVAMVPGERTLEGLILQLSVLFNLNLISMPTKGLLVDRKEEQRIANSQVDLLSIRTSSVNVAVGSLSGGNAQKVVIGKCLASEPKVLLLNNPTRGIDVGARYEIYQIIDKLRNDGISIIMVSEDLPELLGMSDRLIIMKSGKISKLFTSTDGLTEEEVISYMI